MKSNKLYFTQSSRKSRFYFLRFKNFKDEKITPSIRKIPIKILVALKFGRLKVAKRYDKKSVRSQIRWWRFKVKLIYSLKIEIYSQSVAISRMKLFEIFLRIWQANSSVAIWIIKVSEILKRTRSGCALSHINFTLTAL